MPESQNIEYKQSWHDDYLKWVCGFANSNGGVMYIGKDDSGAITGLNNYRRLMDDLPNKIRNSIGISAEVNLHNELDNYYIEIITQPHSVPVSLRGKYYIRSGSTNQELTGTSLTEFLLRKLGNSWDNLVEESATLEDINEESLRDFIDASNSSGRLSNITSLTKYELLDKLHLLNNNRPKRAAIILFGKDPVKFYPNAIVKIGKFGGSDEDIIYQEVQEGNIIDLLKKVPEQLNNKFLTKKIDFMGLQRIEKGEYPVAALREMILNALVHKNYMGSSIQIKVYDNMITIWNEGILPEGMDIESLRRTHISRPRNPMIADVCFKAGYIDSWGRGTLKIFNSCREAGLPNPNIQEIDGGILVSIFKDHLSPEQLRLLDLNDRQIKAVLFLKDNVKITNSGYQTLCEVSERTALRDLDHLVSLKILQKSGDKKSTKYKLVR